MPITPFHLGPGAVFKAIGGRQFSFMVFGGSQVLIDLEPAVQLYRGADVLHGYSHTLAGALVIGGLATAIGRPISAWVLRRLPGKYEMFSWRAAATGAFVGTLSHLVFDAVMHPDMHPLWPLSPANPLLGAVDIGALHRACLVSGVVGGLWVWRAAVRAGDG